MLRAPLVVLLTALGTANAGDLTPPPGPIWCSPEATLWGLRTSG